MFERFLIRLLMAMALCIAIMAFALVPVPVDAKGDPDLPAPAFEQSNLYRLEVALLAFYGDLLLITPAFSGLVRGRLPIEISTRGARFAGDAERSTELDEAAIRKLEETTNDLDQRVTYTHLEIKRLNESAGRDSTQPEVGSKR